MTETRSPERVDDTLTPRRPERRRPLTPRALAILTISVVVVGALAALFASLAQTPLYAAQTDILVDPAPDLSDTALNRTLATQDLILRSGAVLGAVSKATKISVKDIDKALTTKIVGQSNVIRFSIVSVDRGTAQTLAQMITNEYQKQTVALNPSQTPAPAPEQTPAQTPVYKLSVLTPAHVLSDPVRPRPVQALALGALVGVFIAAGMVLTLRRPWWVPRDDSGIGGR
ncbi:MAG: hypothetical protein ACRDZ4_21720 [Egibacteraceae bacterium]